MEYQETFVREKRRAARDTYEGLVSSAVGLATVAAAAATASGADDAAPVKPVPNLSTPEILAAYDSYTGINTFLEQYEGIYGVYNSLGPVATKLGTNLERKQTADTTVGILRKAAEEAPGDASKRLAYEKGLEEAAAVNRTIQTLAQSQSDIDRQIQDMRATLRSNYEALMNPAEIVQNDYTISSFMAYGAVLGGATPGGQA